MHVLLVCSDGGHLYELLNLKEYWSRYEHSWVTFNKNDAATLLENENIIPAYYPTTRNIKNLFRNFALALRTLYTMRPQLIVSTGAGIAVPFFYAAKLFRVPTIYIESITRMSDLSLTGLLVYPVANHFFVQWPALAEKHEKAEYRGRIV